MGSIFGVLNTARSGLLAQQAALSVTGNNISNVNTPGYSRQVADLEDVSTGGVTVGSVTRMTDQFATAQLRNSNAQLGSSSTLATNLQQLESALGQSAEDGISGSLQTFFNSWQELATNPGGSTERETVLQGGQQLVTDFQGISSQITQIRGQLDTQVSQQVQQVNSLTTQIAALDTQITAIPQGASSDADQNSQANSLLDQRDNLINQLSSIVPTRTIQDASGTLTLFAGNQVLVEGGTAHSLGTVANTANGGYQEVTVTDASGKQVSIGGSLTTGSLGALLQARDTYGQAAQDQVDRVAAQITRDINVQHEAGTGLDGVSGRDFFDGLQATATVPTWSNKGGVGVTSATITDQTQLTFDDYQIQFTNPTTFNIVDTTTGANVSTGNAYTAGGNINFGGMQVVLNSSSGAPQAGDVVNVNSYAGTTSRMALSAAVANNPSAIAAGTSSAPGDNTNATSIANLSTQSTMGNPPNMTYQQYYDALRLNVSTGAAAASDAEQQQSTSQTQIQNLLNSTSGVSTDEEATNLIAFQRAFEASSKVVSTVDELLQTVIGMITT